MGDDVHALKNAQIAYTKVDKAFIKVFNKYTDFIDIFLLILITKLLKYMRINNHVIEFIDNKKPLYNFIYSIKLVKLETFKTYINNNLANGFIRSSKFSTKTPIILDKKPNKSLRLCVNYKGFNNLIIKN